MWQPPTDNLYKFIAIAGIVLFALGLYVPLLKLDEYKLQSVTWNVSERALVAKQLQSLDTSLDEWQCQIDASRRGPKTPGSTKRCEELQAARPKNQEESKVLAVVHAEQNARREILDYLQWQVLVYQIVGGLVVVLGLGLMVFGFQRWYTKVQKFLDAEAEEKARAAGVQAQATA